MCEPCGVGFPYMDGLRLHQRMASVHTGENRHHWKKVIADRLTTKGIVHKEEYHVAGTHRSVDIFVIHDNIMVFVELDEKQHRFGYTPTSELARMQEIAATTPDKPVVFVRWNPHVFHVDGKHKDVSSDARLSRLLDVINAIDSHAIAPLNVVYMFYDVFDGVVKAARDFPHDINVITIVG